MNPLTIRPVQAAHALPMAMMLLILALFWPLSSQADRGSFLPRTMEPTYVQECASCHLAFPPAMLPASSWQRIMSQLGTHYGSDASLDARSHRAIENWLVTHAGTYRRVSEDPPDQRITRSAWFVRKHRQVDSATWRLPSVKSPAHCAACHRGAQQGEFDDNDLVAPPGLPAEQLQRWRH